MTSSIQRPLVGEPAPAIELTEDAGHPWTLRSVRDKTVVLIFHRHIH